MWVVEKGKYVTIALLVGLITNVGLNAWLIPTQGLHGAVVATLSANGIVLIGIWIAMICNDFGVDHTALYVFLLPATLLAGPWIAMTALIAVTATSPDARNCINEVIAVAIEKLPKPKQKSAVTQS